MTATVEKELDPHGVLLRASRDRDELPSLAVAVVLDAGMSDIAAGLARLPEMLRAVTEDPHVLLAAGVAHGLQIGDFAREVDVDRFTFAGDGAAHPLAAYFLARHTSIDCYERHGVKGHVIFVTAHKPGRRVVPDEVRDVVGDHLRGSIPVKAIMQELQDRYVVHAVVPAWADDAAATADAWVRLLGSAVVARPDSIDAVPALIVGLVA